MTSEVLYFEWNPTEVSELLEYLTPDNLRVDIISAIYGRAGVDEADECELYIDIIQLQ